MKGCRDSLCCLLQGFEAPPNQIRIVRKFRAGSVELWAMTGRPLRVRAALVSGKRSEIFVLNQIHQRGILIAGTHVRCLYVNTPLNRRDIGWEILDRFSEYRYSLAVARFITGYLGSSVRRIRAAMICSASARVLHRSFRIQLLMCNGAASVALAPQRHHAPCFQSSWGFFIQNLQIFTCSADLLML